MNIQESFGNHCRELREKINVSQEKFALLMTLHGIVGSPMVDLYLINVKK